MKLNADIGELTGNDAEIVPYLDMGNIACGFHASTPRYMRETVKLSKAHRVCIGAHPGYPDRENFGRVSMSEALTTDQIYDMIFGQVHLLMRIASTEGAKVDYIKPHGALYHDMMADPDIYSAIVRIAAHFDLNLMIPAIPSIQPFLETALVREVTIIREAFADRAYSDEGTLVPRSQADSLYSDTEKIIEQAREIITTKSVISQTGQRVQLQADSLCLHGDHLPSVTAAKAIHQLL